MYTIGQLTAWKAAPPTCVAPRSSLGAITARPDGLFDVEYAAKLFIAWPRERAVPETIELILPARGDDDGLADFFAAYGSDEHDAKRCLDRGAHEVSQGLFWYYYRPENTNCALRAAVAGDADSVVRPRATLVVSDENTAGKSPDTAKSGRTARLVVTAIFGKYEDGATSSGDAGHRSLSPHVPRPARHLRRARDVEPPAERAALRRNDDIHLTFSTAAGPLDVQLFLVDGIRSVPASFDAKYDARTRISDFVSYNGHSASAPTSAPSPRRASSPRPVPDLHGQRLRHLRLCRLRLRDAHAAVNPGAGPNKFFDIITNAMPSYFASNARRQPDGDRGARRPVQDLPGHPRRLRRRPARERHGRGGQRLASAVRRPQIRPIDAVRVPWLSRTVTKKFHRTSALWCATCSMTELSSRSSDRRHDLSERSPMIRATLLALSLILTACGPAWRRKQASIGRQQRQ